MNADVSVIQNQHSDAPRGTSATVDYNDSPVSVLKSSHMVGQTVDLFNPIDDEWNSGEEIPVVISRCMI